MINFTILNKYRRKFHVFALLIVLSSCGSKDKQNNSSNESSTTNTVATKSLKKEKLKLDSLANTTFVSRLKGGINFSNGLSHETFELDKPSVIIVGLDSLEIDQMKRIEGEDSFYITADDLIWYNAQLINKLDSLFIPIKFTDKDSIQILSKDLNTEITKDTTFTLYTYFFFNGIAIKRKKLEDLLNE